MQGIRHQQLLSESAIYTVYNRHTAGQGFDISGSEQIPRVLWQGLAKGLAQKVTTVTGKVCHSP